MTKAEFTKRLEDEFRGMIADVERLALAEIEGHHERMDAQTFADWLRSEIAKANAEPALKYFDTVLRPSCSTPEDAARSLADDWETRYGTHRTTKTKKVHFDPTRVNWQEVWERVSPYFEPPTRRIYQYVPRPFSEYKAAAKAAARAKIFASAADTGTPRQQPPKAEPPKPRIRVMALYLFYRNPEDRTKKGIMQVGKDLGCNPDSFYNEWKRVCKYAYRTEPQYIEDLRSAMEMLVKEGIDISKAEQELRVAEQRA